MIKQLCRISILKTLRINLKYFGLKGLFVLPIIVSRNFHLARLKGSVQLNEYRRGVVKLGFSSVFVSDKKYERGIFYNTGTLIFNGGARIYHGAKIWNEGIIEFGKNFRSASSQFVCKLKITIGNDSLISWDSLLMDTDFHPIYNLQNEIINKDREIVIGNNVWIGCRCIVLHGAQIPDGAIIGTGSTISKKLDKEKSIYVNVNKKVKEEITWSYHEKKE